jgi:hypothetical protein
MGMFDSVRFEDVSMLPKPDKDFSLDLNSLDFQTKSLDNALYLFEISKDKYLYREDGPFREDPTEPSRKCRVDFHGILNFGAYHSTDLIDYSVEYKAKFTDGVLQDIELLSYNIYHHESKKIKIEEYKKEYKKEKNKISNKIISFLQNVLIIYPFKLLGINFVSNVRGIFRSKKLALCFYVPKFTLIALKTSFGISLDKTATELSFNKGLISTEFCFKIFGFGFMITKFKEDLYEF